MADIIVDKIEGEEKGQRVYYETRTMLDRLLGINIREIENACNRTANSYREKWGAKNPMDRMIEENLSNLTYGEGIRELYPPFMLTRPHTIHIDIQNSFDASNPEGCANVTTTIENPLNLTLRW